MIKLYDKNEKVVYEEDLDFEKFTVQKFIKRGLKYSKLKETDLDIEYTINQLNESNNFDVKLILLIDDDIYLRDLYREYLERSCHYVVDFPSADEALCEFKKNPTKFDVILTDNMMPGKDNGSSFAKKVKAISPNISVYIITGDTSSIDQDIFDYEIDGTIAKPVKNYTFQLTIGNGKVDNNELEDEDLRLIA